MKLTDTEVLALIAEGWSNNRLRKEKGIGVPRSKKLRGLHIPTQKPKYRESRTSLEKDLDFIIADDSHLQDEINDLERQIELLEADIYRLKNTSNASVTPSLPSPREFILFIKSLDAKLYPDCDAMIKRVKIHNRKTFIFDVLLLLEIYGESH